MMGKETRRVSFWQPVIAPLKAGFELVTAHWWLLLLPMAVDIFLWIGPRLSVAPVWRELVSALPAGAVPAESLAQLAEAASSTNLFSLLSFPFFGVPVLMSGMLAPEATPLSTLTFPLDGGGLTLGVALLVAAGGIVLAAAYHGLLVRALIGPHAAGMARFGQLPRLVVRLVGLILFVTCTLFLMYLPLSLFAVLVGLLSPTISLIVLTIGIAFMMWYFLFIGFSVHGIVLGGLPVLAAVRASVRLVQQHMATALWLLLVVYGSRFLLNLLWRTVDIGSWLTLASIAGHAFVATSLVAGTYVYFAERVGFGTLETAPSE